MHFTVSTIKALPAKTKRYLKRETKSPGFCVRVTPTGVKTFLYVFTLNGKRNELNLGRFPEVSPEEARQTYLNKLNENAAVAQSALPADLTILDAYRKCEQHMKAEGRAKGTIYNYANEIYDFCNHRGNLPVSSVSSGIIRDYVELLHSNYTTKGNKAKAALSVLFNWICYNYPDLQNPCGNIRKKEEKPKDRKLSSSELKIVLPAILSTSIKPWNKTILLLCLMLGQRPSEVTGMHAAELDLANARWTIPPERSKNRKEHLVALPKQAAHLLQQYGAEKTEGLVFQGNKGQPVNRHGPRQSLRRLMAELDLPHASTHDLRRTAAHHMSSLGFSIEIIGRILNHSRSDITSMTYAQYSQFYLEKEKREALQAWVDHLEELTGVSLVSVIGPRNPVGMNPAL